MQMPRTVRCRDAHGAKMARTHLQRCPGRRDTEIPGVQRCPGCKEAPVTTNTCGFGLHTLTPGASSKENLDSEADMGTIGGFHVLHMMCLQKASLPRCAELPRDSQSWTELI